MTVAYVLFLGLGAWGAARGSEALVLFAASAALVAAWRRHGENLAEGQARRLLLLILLPGVAAGLAGFLAPVIVSAGTAAAAWRLASLARAALLATTLVGTTAVRADKEAERLMRAATADEDGERGRVQQSVELSRALRAVLASSTTGEALASLNAAARRLNLPNPDAAFVLENDGFRAAFQPSPPQAPIVEALIAQARLALLRSVRMEQLREVSRTDWLTGLPNRRALDEVLPTERRRALALGLELSYAMIDIDHFKRFNDTHGHVVGDAVLMTVAQQLRHVARKSDYVARYGGEEFALLLPESGVDAARLLAERVQKHLAENPARPAGHTQALPITVSIGISAGGLDAADKALYAAKRNGRNRVEVA